MIWSIIDWVRGWRKIIQIEFEFLNFGTQSAEFINVKVVRSTHNKVGWATRRSDTENRILTASAETHDVELAERQH